MTKDEMLQSLQLFCKVSRSNINNYYLLFWAGILNQKVLTCVAFSNIVCNLLIMVVADFLFLPTKM